jgi:DNA excision repair protein ERCC-3
LPGEVVSFIRKSTETYGKAKLLLRENEYYIESESKAVATTLLREPAIKVSLNNAD